MECPYLSVINRKGICKRMAEEGTNPEISDFDVQHYCRGNPVNCYYFRTAETQVQITSEKAATRRLGQIFKLP